MVAEEEDEEEEAEAEEVGEGEDADAPKGKLKELDGDCRFAREQDCDLRLFDFEAFGGFGKEVRSTLRERGEPAEQQTFARSAPR